MSVDEIERVTGEKIPVADYAKHDRPSQSWLIPHGCDKSSAIQSILAQPTNQ